MNLTNFKPQLVGTGDANSFIFKNDVVAIEPKIDGVRIILVKKDNEIRLFSRFMRDWTERFEPIINNLRDAIKTKNCVLDGEMAVLKNGKMTSSNFVMRNKLAADERYVYFPFDILESGNCDFTDKDLITRKQNLIFIISDNQSIALVPFTMINNSEDFMNIYKKVLESGGEGVVLKNLNAYEQNGRYSWLKKKPFETLDLKIVDKKQRKDSKGWIYALDDNSNIVGKVMSTERFDIGQIVEVKYEKKFEKNDKTYKLRFPKIVRLREDLKGGE